MAPLRAEPQSLACGLLPVGGGRHSAGGHREADAVVLLLKPHGDAVLFGDGPARKGGAVRRALQDQMHFFARIEHRSALGGICRRAAGQGERIALLVLCGEPGEVLVAAVNGALFKPTGKAAVPILRRADNDLGGGVCVDVVQDADVTAAADGIRQDAAAQGVEQFELAAAADDGTVDGGVVGRAAGDGDIAALRPR